MAVSIMTIIVPHASKVSVFIAEFVVYHSWVGNPGAAAIGHTRFLRK